MKKRKESLRAKRASFRKTNNRVNTLNTHTIPRGGVRL